MSPAIDLNQTLRFCAFNIITTLTGVIFVAIGVKKRGYLIYGMGCILYFLALSTGPYTSSEQGSFDLVVCFVILAIGAISLILIENKNGIRTVFAKKTEAKGWDNLSIKEKWRIISSREPYKERYMPKYDNLYLKLFAEYDDKNIPDELMMAFDWLEEGKWETAKKRFTDESMSYHRPSPYPYIGRALSDLKINTLQGIAENIGKIRYLCNYEYEKAVALGGEKITKPIEKLLSSASHVSEKTTNNTTVRSTKDAPMQKDQHRRPSGEKNEQPNAIINEKLSAILNEISTMDKTDKLLFLSDALENGMIDLDEYGVLLSQL